MLDDEPPIDGISILDDDDPESILDDEEDDDPESLLEDDDDPESLGDNGNDPGPAIATSSGNAFATPAPVETELNPRPVTITAPATRCLVVLKGFVVLTVRLPVHPSNGE
jgi:hypothetical protein